MYSKSIHSSIGWNQLTVLPSSIFKLKKNHVILQIFFPASIFPSEDAELSMSVGAMVSVKLTTRIGTRE